MLAHTRDLHDREFRRKTGSLDHIGQGFGQRQRRNFPDRAAFVANQKRNHRGGVMVMRTGKKGVSALDAMNQAIFH